MDNEEVMTKETPTGNVNPLEDLIAMVQALSQEGALEPAKAEQIMAILQGGAEKPTPKVDAEQERADREEAEKAFGIKFIR